jgi:hypothetical protein
MSQTRNTILLTWSGYQASRTGIFARFRRKLGSLPINLLEEAVNTSKKNLVALGLVALLATAGLKADEASQPSDANQSAIEDVNSALGALTNRMNALESKTGSGVEVHGFAEIDMFNDDTQSFNETVGDGAVKLPNSSFAADNGSTQFSPRNSRIDVLGQTTVGGWKTKGYVEGDFLGFEGSAPAYGSTGAGTNDAGENTEYKFYTQPTFRLRHAYVDANNTDTGFEVLAGQWWSLFGWNMDYTLATVSDAPVMATLYERTPQLRIQENLGGGDWTLQLAGDMEKPEQAQSEAPNVNEGIRFMMNSWTGRFAGATSASKAVPFSIGISETNARYDWAVSSTALSGETDSNMWGSAVAVDALIPLLPSDADGFSIVLGGETSSGAGDTDGFNGGGFSGLKGLTPLGGAPAGAAVDSNLDPGVVGLDKANRVELVDIQSWNAQIQISLPRSVGTIFTAGYGSIFSPNDYLLVNTPAFAANAVYNSDVNMFVNVMQDFTTNIRFALEYSEFATNYLSGVATEKGPNVTAYDHRVQLSSYYRF